MASNLLGNSNKISALAKPSDAAFTNFWEVNDACLVSGIRSTWELETAFNIFNDDEPDMNDADHYSLARLFMVLEKQLDEVVAKISAIEGDNPDGNSPLIIGRSPVATLNGSGEGIVALHSNTGTSTNEKYNFKFGFGYNGGSVTTDAANIVVQKGGNFSSGSSSSATFDIRTMVKGTSESKMFINSLGNVIFNPAQGTGYITTGHYGDHEQITLLPYMFLPNDDSSYYNRCAVDNGGQIMVKSSSLELYCYFRIPMGMKATAFKVHGTKGTAASTPTLNLYKYEIDDGVASGVSITNGTLGAASEAVIDGGTGITATQTNYCAIRVNTNSTSNRIYGGYVKIETV